jgi:hypothetical protein
LLSDRIHTLLAAIQELLQRHSAVMPSGEFAPEHDNVTSMRDLAQDASLRRRTPSWRRVMRGIQ